MSDGMHNEINFIGKDEPSEVDPAAICSRLVLQVRYHDRDHGWQEWETIEGRRLEEKYGATPEEWKWACAGWIEIGGRYEYRILRVSEAMDWSISFAENTKLANG
jgi:hypothetical protein